VYCELFVGQADTSPFSVNVYEYPGGIDWVARRLNVTPTGSHRWLVFDLETQSGQSFTKDKQYEFRFTRSGSDSINYYYQTGYAYEYGYLRVGGTDCGRRQAA